MKPQIKLGFSSFYVQRSLVEASLTRGYICGYLRSSMRVLLPKDEIEEVFTRYEQVCAAYPRLDTDMVSCHMDLKLEKVLWKQWPAFAPGSMNAEVSVPMEAVGSGVGQRHLGYRGERSSPGCELSFLPYYRHPEVS